MTQVSSLAEAAPVVVVIDDDASVRVALDNLPGSVGLAVQTFASIDEFLTWEMPRTSICLVLDVRMPGRNGLDFQQELLKSQHEMSVVFITAHGDIPMSVRAMKAGAIEFLTKPFRDQDLLDAIYAGLAKSRARRGEIAAVAGLRSRYDSLSAREREIMSFVIKGQLTKQIAAKLHLSEITVKVCRGQIMKKMGASSLLELGRMSEKLGRRIDD
jgi:FixJ family two-component response regulator